MFSCNDEPHPNRFLVTKFSLQWEEIEVDEPPTLGVDYTDVPMSEYDVIRLIRDFPFKEEDTVTYAGCTYFTDNPYSTDEQEGVLIRDSLGGIPKEEVILRWMRKARETQFQQEGHHGGRRMESY